MKKNILLIVILILSFSLYSETAISADIGSLYRKNSLSIDNFSTSAYIENKYIKISEQINFINTKNIRFSINDFLSYSLKKLNITTSNTAINIYTGNKFLKSIGTNLCIGTSDAKDGSLLIIKMLPSLSCLGTGISIDFYENWNFTYNYLNINLSANDNIASFSINGEGNLYNFIITKKILFSPNDTLNLNMGLCKGEAYYNGDITPFLFNKKYLIDGDFDLLNVYLLGNYTKFLYPVTLSFGTGISYFPKMKSSTVVTTKTKFIFGKWLSEDTLYTPELLDNNILIPFNLSMDLELPIFNTHSNFKLSKLFLIPINLNKHEDIKIEDIKYDNNELQEILLSGLSLEFSFHF